MTLTPEELQRYSRQIILPQVGQAGQEGLRAARVLIVGLGGLGSPASLYLAAAGVGTLGLAEFDTIAMHNLQRQILFDTSSVGECKLDHATRRLRALNPHVELLSHPEGLHPDNARDLVRAYDLVLDGSDNFPARYLCNDACYFERKPLGHASLYQFEGQFMLLQPGADGPCYRCLFPRMPAPGEVPSCEEAGIFGALCGVIGSLQALEAIKLLARAASPQTGQVTRFDALGGRFATVKVARDPHCPLCGATPSIHEIAPENYTSACEAPSNSSSNADVDAPIELTPEDFSKRRAEFHLVDVREPFERKIVEIAESQLIPMRELPGRLNDIPRDRPVVVYCHHGWRSLTAAKLLRKHGFTGAASLRGGIHQWAKEIDPSLPLY